jgi:hypothetical protein
MERETILTKKISSIELKPAPWKKAEVWFMIHEQISTGRKSFRFYYYAAAVIFFMFFNIYRLQQVRIESVAANNQQSTISSIQNQSIENNVDLDKIALTQSNYTRKKSQSRVVVVQPSEVLDSDRELIDVDIQLPPVELILNSTKTVVVPQRVEPIVGVIQSPVNDVASVKPKRKKLFHKLEPAEKEFEVGHQNTIVIARIK